MDVLDNSIKFQAFDDTWESNVLEFNAVNITGFRMVDTSRKYVQDFLQKWSVLDAVQFPGAGKESISVSVYNLTVGSTLIL